jgi:hypothetical protein
VRRGTVASTRRGLTLREIHRDLEFTGMDTHCGSAVGLRENRENQETQT